MARYLLHSAAWRKEVGMITSLKILGLLGVTTLAAILSAPARGDGFSFGFRRNSSRFPAPTPLQRFTSQAQVRQQAFFSQSVFSHPPITPMPPVPFSQVWTLQLPPWASQSATNYVSPPARFQYQTGYYVAPTVYSFSPTYYVPSSTIVYQSPLPINYYSNGVAPGFGRQQLSPNFGMGNRW
jgi:hypothetical protein